MAGETEEKNLPPSHRKLRKAREKGQVASSTDFVNALALAAGVIVLVTSWPQYVEIFTGSLRLGMDSAIRRNQGGELRAMTSIIVLIAQTMAPLLVIVAAAAFAGHVIHKKGLIFSMEPIKPDFNRISIGAGLGRIFSAKNGAEFVIALLRCLFWFTTAGLIVWYAMPQVVMSLSCELPCVTTTGVDLIRRLLIVAVLMIIVLGLLDLPFQTLMFLRDQKMSRTEFKRELKETEGSPEFAGYRREQYRQMASAGGLRQASLVIMSSGEAVAIQYDAVEQPIPIVVAKGRGIHADPILKAAKTMGTPVEVDPRLATELIRIGIGSIVPEREFNAVAMALVRHGKAG